MSSIFAELKLTMRALRRSPGFVVAATVTLALGIGANVAVFSVADAVALHPLPYRDADGLVAVQYAGNASSSAARLDRLAAGRTYASLAGYSGWGFVYTTANGPLRLRGARITPNLFAMLGVAPARGRMFTDDEARLGAGDVAVLSDAMWRSEFASDTSVVGRSILLDGRRFFVVGVMPPGFAFPRRDIQIWTPAPLNRTDSSAYGAGMLTLIARLSPGVTTAAASAELRRFRSVLRAEAGVTEAFDPTETRVIQLADQMATGHGARLLLLAGIVAVVLLIACANVANLMLLRATERGRSFAIRAALGASQWALVRVSLLESVALSFTGGMLGIITAFMLRAPLIAVLTDGAPLLRRGMLDVRLLGITLLITTATALLVGAFPAIRAWRPNIASLLQEGARGQSTSSRWRDALVVSELALAFTLAVAAGLLLKSLRSVAHMDPGFQADRVLSVRVSLPEAKYSEPTLLLNYWSRATERLRSLSGVAAVGGIHLTPMGLNNWNPDLTVEGRPDPRPGESRSVDWRIVTPEYFRAMGIPLVKGRSFTDRDDAGAPSVAIVNAALVRAYLGDGDPIGKRVVTGFEGKNKWTTVVGVVGNVRGHGLGVDPVPEMYRPLAQHPIEALTVMLRTANTIEPGRLVSTVKRSLAPLDPDVVVDEFQSMRTIADESISAPRHLSALVAGFGGLALLLASIGVFGVVSFAVARRTREIGIRVALGASRGSILALILRQGVRLTLIAAGLGALLALAGGRLLQTALFLTSPVDPWAFGAAFVVLFLVALLATYLPSRRAVRVDPVLALRAD